MIPLHSNGRKWRGTEEPPDKGERAEWKNWLETQHSKAWRPSLFMPNAAKSLQLCPTLCDPIESSPPGSPIPGILQARTLEWVAISFSNAWKWSHSVVSTLSDPMDCSLPGSSAHGIFQARVLEWSDIAFSASCQIEGEKVEAVTDFLFSGSQITVDDDCSHEIKRCFLLWKKAMTNLDSILRSGSITLPTKVRTVKTMHFPVVTYRCENWTIKKAEHRITDAFKCDAFKRRLFRIPWITRRSNQSILKEIKVMRWLERITDSMDMNLSKLREIWRTGLPYRLHAAVHGVAKCRTCLSDGTATA